MTVHLHREIENLKQRLLAICRLVESQVEMAVRAMEEGDVEMAHVVERQDADVDRQEVDIEEECLRMLALYQPVAIDLRLIVASLKINNDLERVGDLAVNIAHKVASLRADPDAEIPADLCEMAAKTRTMLHDAVDSLVSQDAEAAQAVCARDDEIDAMKRQIRVQIEQSMRGNPASASASLKLLGVSRNLERIADYSTNIAEDVIYMIEGRIIRHRRE
jgi:phosphate transport system protein